MDIFTFIVGVHRYECRLSQGMQVSRNARWMVLYDSTPPRVFRFSQISFLKHFEMIQTLWLGGTIEIDSSNVGPLESIAEELGYDKLLKRCSKFGSLREADLLRRIEKRRIGDCLLDDIVAFIAARFWRFSLSPWIQELDVEILADVFVHPNLLYVLKINYHISFYVANLMKKLRGNF
jgi:hypothetical protein